MVPIGPAFCHESGSSVSSPGSMRQLGIQPAACHSLNTARSSSSTLLSRRPDHGCAVPGRSAPRVRSRPSLIDPIRFAPADAIEPLLQDVSGPSHEISLSQRRRPPAVFDQLVVGIARSICWWRPWRLKISQRAVGTDHCPSPCLVPRLLWHTLLPPLCTLKPKRLFGLDWHQFHPGFSLRSNHPTRANRNLPAIPFRHGHLHAVEIGFSSPAFLAGFEALSRIQASTSS